MVFNLLVESLALSDDWCKLDGNH